MIGPDLDAGANLSHSEPRTMPGRTRATVHDPGTDRQARRRRGRCGRSRVNTLRRALGMSGEPAGEFPPYAPEANAHTTPRLGGSPPVNTGLHLPRASSRVGGG